MKKPVSVAVRRRGAPEPQNDFVVVEVEKLDLEPAGSMARGVLISSLCALAGAGVWFALARFTGHELSPVAWLVGLAAGGGMLIGLHQTSRAAGVVSGALAIAGILLGKVLVFSLVTLPLLGLLSLLAQEQLRQGGIDPQHATIQQWQSARDKAGGILRDMDFSTREAAIEKGQETIRASGNPMSYLSEKDRDALFFRYTFKPIDLLYAALAVGTAFKIATYGGRSQRS
jgi:hypothetical protein